MTSQFSVRHEDGTVITSEMDTEEMALLNLPGRELFGPMTADERVQFGLLADLSLTHARKLVIWMNRDEDRELVSKITDTRDRLANNTMKMGPEAVIRILREYTIEINKSLDEARRKIKK